MEESTTNPSVLVSDDSGELKEEYDSNVFYGQWRYMQNIGDGGVIGELGGNSWSITIDQLGYSNVSSLIAYGATSSIALDMDLGKDIVLTAGGGNPVPEPATIFIFGTGLAGLVGTRLRRHKK